MQKAPHPVSPVTLVQEYVKNLILKESPESSPTSKFSSQAEHKDGPIFHMEYINTGILHEELEKKLKKAMRSARIVLWEPVPIGGRVRFNIYGNPTELWKEIKQHALGPDNASPEPQR